VRGQAVRHHVEQWLKAADHGSVTVNYTWRTPIDQYSGLYREMQHGTMIGSVTKLHLEDHDVRICGYLVGYEYPTPLYVDGALSLVVFCTYGCSIAFNKLCFGVRRTPLT
jgi:hypothetical protein